MPAPFEKSQEERTEQPTQYRREEFRRQGNVAVSRELLSVVLFLAVGGALYFGMSMIFREFSQVATRQFTFSDLTLDKSTTLIMLFESAEAWGWIVGPVMVVALAAGLAVCALQVGFHVSTESLTLKWERLNPVSGFQRIWSSRGLVEALKAVLKLGIAGLVVWLFIRSHVQGAFVLTQGSVEGSVALMLTLISKLFFILVATFAALAALDYGFQRWQLEKQMRMTKSEVKEEFKLREGDPLIKSRIRSLQRKMASRRMMEAVPKADVIVTNPTHLAVALQYDTKNMFAPKVTAKGAEAVAEKIKEIARFNRIPIVENKPLARTLFKKIDIGSFIPKELYKAVAEVLAYVYRLKGISKGLTQAHG